MIQTGSRLEEFGWHSWGTCFMPRVQKSLPHCAFSQQLLNVVFPSYCKKEGYSFWRMTFNFFYRCFFNLWVISNTAHTVSKASGFLCVCVCSDAVCPYMCLYLYLNLHNNMSCRDLMTAVVDFLFFVTPVWWLHSRILLQLQLSQLVSSMCRRGSLLTWGTSCHFIIPLCLVS